MTHNTSKWLVVKLADIGDLITATPALARLREARPDAEIHLLTTGHSAPVIPADLADRVIGFDKFAFDRPADLLRPGNLRHGLGLARVLRSEGYDTVLILHHLTTPFGALKYAALALATGAPRRIGLDNGRGWFLTDHVPDEGFGAAHEVTCWLRLADVLLGEASTPHTPDRHPLRVSITDSDQAWAADRLGVMPPPVVAIHPGSGGYSPARRWPAESFARVADRLHAAGARIVLIGGPQDDTAITAAAMTHAPLDLSGQTTLGQLGAVLARCDLFIGADSGVMHLAAAAGAPVLALFGPSNARAWGPWTTAGRVLHSGVLCSPCSYVRHTVGQREGCPARTCMRLLTPEQVTGAALEHLQGRATWSATPAPDASSEQTRLPTPVRVLGIPLHPITWAGLRETLRAWMAEDRAHQFCTANPEFVMMAQRDIHFYTVLNRVDLCVADGQGLLWAARRLGTPLPVRITGSDGVPLIAQWAAEEGWRLFLLGAAEGVAEEAAARLQARYPGLQIAGTYAGSPAAEEEDAIVERINASGADILFVAYGAPRQDKWIARNLPRLQVRTAAGIGGALDFIVGTQKRAPAGWQRLGLEWLYRLLQEPWRWKRMTRLPRFVLAVLRRGARGPAAFEGPARPTRP
ncbi:MAG: WecB/TagA/CpsF family glycosyltransferase [Anaerolineae bacterium]|nr:WecB/TagA/CpsF family glycosyltransferase [Anaerolineae bacterium]